MFGVFMGGGCEIIRIRSKFVECTLQRVKISGGGLWSACGVEKCVLKGDVLGAYNIKK